MQRTHVLLPVKSDGHCATCRVAMTRYFGAPGFCLQWKNYQNLLCIRIVLFIKRSHYKSFIFLYIKKCRKKPRHQLPIKYKRKF